jgi:hypothetical protein
MHCLCRVPPKSSRISCGCLHACLWSASGHAHVPATQLIHPHALQVVRVTPDDVWPVAEITPAGIKWVKLTQMCQTRDVYEYI